MKSVLILGCGPAGMFAAHAATLAGFQPIIVSRKRKSEMYGAQYLHRPIDGLTEGDGFQVRYVLHGDNDSYRQKVYGAGYRGPTSPDDLVGDHTAWNIRAAYDMAWQMYQDKIVPLTFASPMEVHGFIGKTERVSHFISTIPAPLLCIDPSHGFAQTQVRAIGDAPEKGRFSPITADLNTVECSGRRDDSWYRKSNILGYNTVEWPMSANPPLPDIAVINKPISTDCTCLPQVHRVGRYGKWTKGVLSHEAFYETLEGLNSGQVD